MQLKKIIAVLALIPFLIEVAKAEELSDLKNAYNTYYQSIQNNLEKIKSLEKKNEDLKKLFDELGLKLAIYGSSGTLITTTSNTGATLTNSGITNSGTEKASNVEKYNQIISKINSMSLTIFSDNNLSSGSTIGLFEFIEPDAFFISIDDGNNPTGVTAFKTKILYNYDTDLSFAVSGVFYLDYKSGYYITKRGKNPFAKANRIRVKNPSYKGKLLDIATPSSVTNTNSSVSIASNNSDSIATGINVTADMIKTAYSKNKLTDAIKLSDEYIKKDPNNIDILRIRYRSFYMIGKYNNSLDEIKKIDVIQGTSITKVVACDGSAIARLAKNMDLNKKYGDICKNK